MIDDEDNESFIGSILPKRGAFHSLSFSVLREIEPDDLLRIAKGSTLAHRPIQQIRAIHHRIAQLMAQGFSLNEVSVMSGSSLDRINKLKADPTFNDLLTYYQDQIGTIAIEDGQRIQDKLKVAAETALDEINDRLMDEEKRTAIPISELRKITEMGADRTVAPPKASLQLTTPPQQITLNIGAPRFAETNTKIKNKVIEHELKPENKDENSDEEEEDKL